VKPKAGDAFEDVLYGSESELEDSDEEEGRNQKSEGRNNKKTVGGKFGARLRIDDEEPMDLLHGAASHITSTQAFIPLFSLEASCSLPLIGAQNNKRRKPGQDAAHFKVDEDTGKMIIDEKDSDSEDNDNSGPQKDTADIAGAAYHETQTSVDGFVRGQGGHVKFHRDTKKRRREELESAIEDVEMADGDGGGKKKIPKRKQDARLGHEFKAKVCLFSSHLNKHI
jgi:ribosomal RNA-processing protein 12